MFKNIAIGVASSIAILAGAGAASAQTYTWSNIGTNYDVAGVVYLQHSITLPDCVVARGDLVAKVRAGADDELDVSGVPYPFQKPFSFCGTVEALDYNWVLQVTGAPTGTVYPVLLKGIAARTILGSKCKGDIAGTFDNTGSVLVASGTIPVVSGSTSPPTCFVSVDLDAPTLQVVP